MNLAEPGESRVFFAIWPPLALRQELHALSQTLQQHTGGRVIKPESLHLTLVFIGTVGPPQIDALCACADALPLPGTELVLDQVGFWTRAGVVWAGSRHPDPDLLGFAAELHDRVQHLGFRLQKRVFRPHITLIRRARRRARTAPIRLNWRLTELTLTASELDPAGANYTVLRRWSSAGDME